MYICVIYIYTRTLYMLYQSTQRDKGICFSETQIISISPFLNNKHVIFDLASLVNP